MTKEEKKMKRYCSAVERRLNLPKELKNRVMSDFQSSIAARREAGMTDEEIYAELGAAQKAAADLNEQMKEYTYRKSPWRYLFAAAAIYGGMKLLPGLVVNLIYLGVRIRNHFSADMMGLSSTTAASIGVIGGADGPTAIFVTTPPWVHFMVPLILVIAGIWGFIRLSRCKKK